MSRLIAFTHDAGFAHAPPNDGPHVERPDRLTAARAGLDAWQGDLAWKTAREATRSEILGVHTPEHVERVQAACAAGAWIDPDTYAMPESWRAALVSAGAAVEAATEAAAGRPAFAVTRPPGHHATPERAMGFCLLNNVAIAAHALTRDGKRVAIVDDDEERSSSSGQTTARRVAVVDDDEELRCASGQTTARRVAVVDLDVHHGNGTEDVFEARDDVLYVSLHQAPLYPGTGHVEDTGTGAGEGFTLNLPVPAGTGHAGWLACIDGAVLPALRAFAPDVVLVSAGFDAHAKDPLGGLNLVAQSYHAAILRLREVAGDRVAAVLEGGYNLDAIRASATATAAALVGAPESPVVEDVPAGVDPWPSLREPVARAHAKRGFFD